MKRLLTPKVRDIEDIWKLHIERIKIMRKDGNAPVDTMGCHRLADPLASPKVHRFQILLALMLSSQTRDEVTASAMARLKEHGCSIDDMINIPTDELEKILCPVGFYKPEKNQNRDKLARNRLNQTLKQQKVLEKSCLHSKTAAVLNEKYDGDVPDSVEGLCGLPGVGPKMAHLVLQIAWQKNEGIAVDTHVHRISNRLGWFTTSTPEKTRLELQKMIPREDWQNINHLLVGFGQTVCLPVGPKCSSCLCNDICPSSKTKTKVDKVEEETERQEIVKIRKISSKVKTEISAQKLVRTRSKKII